MTEEMKKVPARYIGGHPAILGAFGGPYYDGKGRPLTSLLLNYGDTLMMPEGEVRGETYIITPQNSEFVGTGKVVKKDIHEGLSESTLISLGYQWHLGRSDFEEITEEQPAPVPSSTPPPVETIATEAQVEQPAESEVV